MEKTLARNLHFPKGLGTTNRCHPIMRAVFEKWKNVNSPLPELTDRKLFIKGSGKELKRIGQHIKPYEIMSPHGLLFRTVYSSLFIECVLTQNIDLNGIYGYTLNKGNLTYSTSGVASGSLNDLETYACRSLYYSLANYGAGWWKHGQSKDSCNWVGHSIADNDPKILLLAIAPYELELRQGFDEDEIVILGRIPLDQIFILNDEIDIVQKTIDLEGSTSLFNDREKIFNSIKDPNKV